ncbi:unnamed protein product [Rotaria magnacalcarata]|uniref:Uncharacterized protein n=3 Tax=Rotaria TaxID=231623 RepID=A0A8S2J7I2_9BILA|nr:unnamed protein product [Rotaria magnacalcarata]CAF3859459.1 unnamed protein product [Rotaria magnacalcarata]
MMHFDKCIIENDRVRCTCGGKVFNGVLLTVGSEAVCNHVMTKMNGISTDTRDSSVSEKYSETSDAHNQLTKRQSTENRSTNSVSVNLTPEIAMNSSSIGTNSDTVIQIIQESIFEMAGNDIVATPPNELLFGNREGECYHFFIRNIADRLASIENTISNLIGYVHRLGEDIASIGSQLKPLSESINIIQNHILAQITPASTVQVSSTVGTSIDDSAVSSLSSKEVLVCVNGNMAQTKNDLKSIGSALRQLIMKTYTRAEILDKKHLNEDDYRFKNITDALKNNFALNDVMMDALSQTFKQTRNQLTKDVRYLKVMKPKSATALNEDTVCGQDDQHNEETPEESNNNKNNRKMMD